MAHTTHADRRPVSRPLDPSALDPAARLAADFGSLDLFERLAAVREEVDGPVVFTTSFGLEDQAITHAIFAQDLAIEIVTLDTGRLFPETHQVWAETEQRYGRPVRAIVPDHSAVEALVGEYGINGFRASVAARHACCGVRKVEPLGRALEGAAAWITGLRAEQSTDRAAVPMPPSTRSAVCSRSIRCWIGSAAAFSISWVRIPFPTICCTIAASCRSAAHPAPARSRRASRSALAAGGGNSKRKRVRPAQPTGAARRLAGSGAARTAKGLVECTA